MVQPTGDNAKGKIYFFGRDISQIPCFRTSFMVGIGGGIGVGFASFFATSNVKKSTYVGFGSYMAITCCYWTYCRYKWAEEELRQKQIKKGIQAKLLLEGTELEKKYEQHTRDV